MQYSITKDSFPLARLILSADETARIQTGSMIYHDPTIKLTTHLNGRKGTSGLGRLVSAIGRSFTSGESSLITQIASSQDQSVCGIATNTPGGIAVLDLTKDQYFINDRCFLAMSEDADYVMQHQSFTKGFLSGTGGLYIMATKGSGLIFVNAFGSLHRFQLDDDEITIDNDHVVAWSQSLTYDLHFDNGLLQSMGTGEGIVNTFRGTGSIYLQSLSLSTFAKQLIPYMPKNNKGD